ncbi:hypothetical protein CAP35_08500 [Chitinophagaceae bacterium IBVUCB1]|nr:hypothetical protein CAP35_08500 [Chitinophagaceae bacterium IBVUCB1]
MDKEYESLYHTEEETNWWFVSRRDMLLKYMDKYGIAKDAKILDIGCGGGTFTALLHDKGYTNLYALDYSPEAIEQVKKKGIPNAFVMDGHHPEFEENTFDLIIASDSLEHLEHDETALKNWHHVLKRGGKAFILVPAYNFLWSEHDDVNYHFRRYTKNGLANKVTQAGFSVLYKGYNYVLLFIPTAIVRIAQKLLKPKRKKEDADGQILLLPRWVNKLLTVFQIAENSLSKHISFPFGVSAVVIVSKQ